MGQSFFSSSVEDIWHMRPFVALTFVLGCTYAAPAELGLAGVHALGYAAAPAAVGVAAAPIAYGAEHYSAGPVVAHAPVAYAAPPAPAPYTTAHQGPGVTTVHQPAPVITKQVHLGQTSYISGYATKIHKPATPHLPIAVPTVLKGIHTVKIVEVPTPVHVDAPYNVPYPVAVQGEPIIKKSVAPAVVTHSHHVNAAPAVAAVAAPAVAGYAGYAGYAAAPVAAIH